MVALEKEVKERAKRDSQKDQAESEAPILNPGINQLLLTQGGYVNRRLLDMFYGADHFFPEWERALPRQSLGMGQGFRGVLDIRSPNAFTD